MNTRRKKDSKKINCVDIMKPITGTSITQLVAFLLFSFFNFLVQIFLGLNHFIWLKGYSSTSSGPNRDWFVIENKRNGLVLGIKGGKQGARVITLPLEGGYNQLWTWQGCSLISKTGYALDILGQCKNVGTRVISWGYNGGISQQWRMERDKIVSCLNGLALDIKDGSKSYKSDIILLPAHHGNINSQSWRLVLYYE